MIEFSRNAHVLKPWRQSYYGQRAHNAVLTMIFWGEINMALLSGQSNTFVKTNIIVIN